MSSTKWEDIRDLEDILNNFSSDMDWTKAPVECAQHFHERLQRFIAFLVESKTLGQIQHYWVRLEVQNRNSLHAHIMLWVNPDDVPRVRDSIVAYVPAEYNTSTSEWIYPTEPHLNKLAKLVVQKQLHTCRQQGCCRDGHCKYGFPFDTQPELHTVFDQDKGKYYYHRPRSIDRNVVPYHPDLLLLWGAHMNLQCVVSASWTLYLLKYALKCEPNGQLNLAVETMRTMGFTGTQEDLLRAANAMISSRPVSTTEAACYLARIPIVSYDPGCNVDYVDSLPPAQRTFLIINKRLEQITHPVEQYIGRPFSQECDELTFTQYHQQHIITKKKLSSRDLVGVDTCDNNNVYRVTGPRVVRFTNCHPVKNPEGFCYNLLLSHIPFRLESELQGQDGTYFSRCVELNLISSMDDLEEHLIQYCYEYFHDMDTIQAMVEGMLGNAPQFVMDHLVMDDADLDVHYSSEATAAATASSVPSSNPTTLVTDEDQSIPNIDLLAAFFDDTPLPQETPCIPEEMDCSAAFDITKNSWYSSVLQDGSVTPDQKEAVDAILGNNIKGLFLLTGGPGTGKTYLSRVLASLFHHQGLKTLMCASTGAAAVRLSRTAQTAHYTLGLAKHTLYMSDLRANDIRRAVLVQADVIIVDEFSQLSAKDINQIINRLRAITNSRSITELFTKKLILFVGDEHQLPCVCRHHQDPICTACRFSESIAWPHSKIIKLKTNVRAAQDQGLLQFQQHVREAQPTQEYIDEVFKDCYITQEAVHDLITPATKILCTHNKDVDHYNNNVALPKFFSPEEILEVPIHSNCASVPECAAWLNNKEQRFHCLTKFALGAPVVLTSNISIPKGAANGATGKTANFLLQ